MEYKARTCAVIALLLLLAAAANFAMSNPETSEFGAPTYRGDKVQILLADVPNIGDFYKEFEVNKENPFVPVHDRLAEKERRTRRTKPPTPATTVVATLPPPRPPIVVKEPPKPAPLELPVLTTKPVNPPNCVGLIAAGGQQVLVVRMGKDGADTKIKVGDKVDGWELLELRFGTARFRDPAGGEQLYVIGLNDAAVQGTTPDSAPAPAQEPAPPDAATAPPAAAPPLSAAPVPTGRMPAGRAAAASAPVAPPGAVTPGIQPPAPAANAPGARGRLGAPLPPVDPTTGK